MKKKSSKKYDEGGIVVGPSHDDGGVHFKVNGSGQHVELEGREAVISSKAFEDDRLYTYKGTNWDILNKINEKYGGNTLYEKVDSIGVGDFVICISSVEDNTVREITGTNEQIISAINESGGCVSMTKGAKVKEILDERRSKKMAGGGAIDKKRDETYKKWRNLVNMSESELRKFYDSEEGRKAGLTTSEAKKQGIGSGRQSARWIIRMKSTPKSEWTDEMWRWAGRQVSFISRMSGNEGALYDDKGRKTRKHLSLLIWGHNPKKKMGGGEMMKLGGDVQDELRIKISNLKDSSKKYKGKYKDIFDILEEDIALYNPYGTTEEEFIGTDLFITITPRPDNYKIEKISLLKDVTILDSGSIRKADEAIESLDNLKNISEDILELENEWQGGVADFGNKEVASFIESLDEYDDYKNEAVDILRSIYGDTFRAYRLISEEQLEDWKSGGDIGAVAISLDLAVAESFRKFALNENNDYILISFEAPVESFVMRGKTEEKEIVIDANQISANNIVEVNNQNYDKGGLIAPNGKPSNLTQEQYKLVRTPEFKAWFGDWENDPANASKVVDGNGEPLVCNHSSRQENIDIFYGGRIFRTKKNQVKPIWFTYKKFNEYASGDDIFQYQCFLNIKNLFDYSKIEDVRILKKSYIEKNGEMLPDYDFDMDWDAQEQFNLPAYIYELGYNGYKFTDEYSIVVFNPNQIKLADGTNTTFDGSNPDIRYKQGGRTISQTPAPSKDRVYGSDKNKPESASSASKASSIELNEKTIESIKTIIGEHNEKYPKRRITLSVAKAVVRRGMGAYSSSHRPTISGGKPNSRVAWGLARLNAFVFKAQHGYSKSGKYSQDNDLLDELGINHRKFEDGGEVKTYYTRTYADGTSQRFSVEDYEKNVLPNLGEGGAIYLAPNGNPSNLTHEQWHLVRTPEFKAWFGDWENDPANASKVIDENGEPLVVYHGGANVSVFNTKDFNYRHFGLVGDWWETGTFFSDSKETAQAYLIKYGKDDTITSCFLNLRNPIIKNARGGMWYNFIPKLFIEGYGYTNKRNDGFIVKEVKEIGESDEFIQNTYNVLSSENIKLADGTNTTFDGGNPDIRYAKGGLIAPNGKPSKLTQEQYKLVRTPEFKAWFGDWENDPANASKVVDENGEPLVVWHGGKQNIRVFKTPTHLGTLPSAMERVNDIFIWKPNFKSDYYECFIDIKKPYKTIDVGIKIEWAKEVRLAKKENFDGLIYKNLHENRGSISYLVFDPEQIKLADGTNTTFDGGNPDIRYKDGGDIIKGGKADGMSLSDIAKHHRVTTEVLLKAYNKGIKHEMEHTSSRKVASEIAKDHIYERLDYYDMLDKAEKMFFKGGNVTPSVKLNPMPSSVEYGLETPTGVVSKLTYAQQLVVRTDAFKEWFGDWEKAAKDYINSGEDDFYKSFENVSKVIDFETLEPKVVFHGTRTNAEFFEFDVSKTKIAGRPYGYFAHNREYSENFTQSSQTGAGNVPVLYQMFLNVRNPFIARGHDYSGKYRKRDWWMTAIKGTLSYNKRGTAAYNQQIDDVVDSQIGKYTDDVFGDESLPFWVLMARDSKRVFKAFLMSHGFDGVSYTENYTTNYDMNNPSEFTSAVAIFDATQVKLADGRNWNFDATNPDMRMKEGGHIATHNNMESTNNEHNEVKKSRFDIIREKISGTYQEDENPKILAEGGEIEELEVENNDYKIYVENLINITHKDGNS